MNPYFDSAGLLTDVIPIGETTENRSLWTVECYFLWNMLQPSQKDLFPALKWHLSFDNVWLSLYGLYDGKHWHPLRDWTKLPKEGFSRDNCIGISAYGLYRNCATYSYFNLCGFSDWRNLLRSPQPQDLIFFGLCANKWWAKYFKWFLRWNIKHTLTHVTQTADKVLKTDGLILSFVRLFALRNNDKKFADIWDNAQDLMAPTLLKYWLTHPSEVIGTFPTTKTIWKQIFSNYFRSSDNPINAIARTLWPD